MLRITSQQPMRRFNQKGQHFSGFLINPNTHKQDTGGVARHYQRYILDEAISAGVATVLSEDLNPYGPEAVDALRLRVSELNPLSTEFARHTKTIEGINKIQTGRNEQAQVVLGIMRDSMAPEIWGPIQQRVDLHREKSELVLQDARAQIKERYDGLPHERKEYIESMVNAVGKCDTKSDILLAITQLTGIQSDTKDWLHHQEEVEGGELQRVLDDELSPEHSQQFWCRALSRRLESQYLQKYRDKAVAALRARECDFQGLCDEIMQDLQYDLEVADAPAVPQHQAPARHAMLASVDESQDAALQIRQAYYAQGYEAHKRRRADSPQQHADPAPGRSDCFYWDGHQCDYEVQENKPCRFSVSHVDGTPTQGHKKFQAKPQRPGAGVLPGFVAAAGTHM